MNIFKRLFYSLFFVVLMAACKKEYYFDSGVHDEKFNGTMVDYLKTRPELFDTLLQVIDLAGMTDYYEKENITFFAPPNTSISQALNSLNRYLRVNGKDTVSQLSQIKSEVWKNFISLYTFKGEYSLRDVPQLDTLDLNTYGGQGFVCINGRPMNIGVIYGNAGGVKYAGYRQLWLAYYREFNNSNNGRINVPVATSNIQPHNGFLHVLRFQYHTFGFSSSDFILQATSKGIDPAK